MAVHDRLRQAGRARGEEHVERVRERQRLELERALRRPGARPTRPRRRARRSAAYGTWTTASRLGSPSRDLGHLLAAVDEPLAPAVAGDGEQQLRLELAEPVEDAAHAELGRARRPDRAEAGAGEEGDERLRDVRQVGDDAVALADPEPLQPGAGARDLLAELAERELERLARLRVRDDRDRVQVVVAAEHVLGEVQPRAREPLRARHLPRAEHALVRRVRADLEEVPERRPEALEVGDRPAPERVVVREVEAAARAAATGGSGRARCARPRPAAASRERRP